MGEDDRRISGLCLKVATKKCCCFVGAGRLKGEGVGTRRLSGVDRVIVLVSQEEQAREGSILLGRSL